MAKEAKTSTFRMKQKAPKKGSVLFESTDPSALLQAMYVMREGAKKNLAIDNLDTVKEIEVSMKVVG